MGLFEALRFGHNVPSLSDSAVLQYKTFPKGHSFGRTPNLRLFTRYIHHSHHISRFLRSGSAAASPNAEFPNTSKEPPVLSALSLSNEIAGSRISSHKYDSSCQKYRQTSVFLQLFLYFEKIIYHLLQNRHGSDSPSHSSFI